jgi:hypothetical protein
MFLEVQFLLIIYALEAYHRRTTKNQELPIEEHNQRIASILGSCPSEYREWLHQKLEYTNEPRLRRRIKELISKYEQVFMSYVDNIGAFVDKIVNTRNYFTHYDSSLKNSAMTDPNKLREMTDKLMGLLEVCLFTEISTVYEIKRIYGHLLNPILTQW